MADTSMIAHSGVILYIYIHVHESCDSVISEYQEVFGYTIDQ